MNDNEKELLNYMVVAPAAEIEIMIPDSIGECAKLLGITADEYSYSLHYLKILTMMRRRWAQAMIAEAMGHNV